MTIIISSARYLSPVTRELDNVYNKAQKALGRNVADSDDREMTARDFAKERRKLVREERKSKKN